MANDKHLHTSIFYSGTCVFTHIDRAFPAQAQTIGPKRVLIRNVTLFDPNHQVEDRVVNILLRDNKLDILTEDKISRNDADMVVNANKGFLLGGLETGKKPSLILFKEDPRDNFSILMDTFIHSIFTVDAGVVVKTAF